MMMSESEDKMMSSMAMVEKKPQRPVGGCVGIFFQLFNWNKSFSKKKLFSNKLLPPAHPHQSSRKFGGDEKLPKNRLIANENSGGFPNMKKKESSNNGTKQKPQMRSPSLVARLMGLESMPAVQKNKSLKEAPQIFYSNNDEGDKFTSPQKGFNSNLVKEKVKNELRPQKLQKTGQSERQVLAKFTSEAFQFKSVLSKSKKHQRSKLVSPLKSPKLSSGRTSSSRLFDVATRFLEPGLQNTNRSRNAITYSSTVNYTLENGNDFVMEREMEKPDILINSEMSIKTHSCKHCGSHLELNLEEKALPFSSSQPKYLNPNLEETKRNPIGPPLSSFEQEKWRVNEKYQEISTPFTAQASREGQSRNLTSRQYKPQRDSQPCIGPKHKPHRQSQVSMVRDRAPNRTNRPSSAANSVKDFGSKTPTKINNVMRNEENSSCNKRGGSLSPVRKRRSTGTSQNGENNCSFSGSTFARQKNTRCNSVGEREIRSDSRSFSSTNHGIGRYKEKYETNNLNSFEFNPMKSGNTPNKVREISSSGESDAKTNAEKLLALSGDELGAILQQKLRELSCQEEDDELVRDGSEPKRTTSVILQELISALTTEKQMIYNDVDVESEDKILSHSPHLSNKRFTFEAKQKTSARRSPGYLQLYEGEHLSPGSVLEASFSNDSCLSSTFGDGSAPTLVADSAEFYFDGLPKLESEAEFFDSSASLKKGCSNIRLLIDLISHVFEVLLNLGFANTGLKRTKLAYAKDVILNMELVSKNATRSLSLGHFLIYELENLARAMWADFSYLLGFKDKKNDNQFKEFVLDCVIEYLDTRYGRYSSCGFKQWTKMSLSSNAKEFVAELFKEVKWWMNFSEYSLDEIIDFEMSHSYGKWNDFEIEAFETGAEIGKDVLQILVDEIVVDLFEGKKCSERI